MTTVSALRRVHPARIEVEPEPLATAELVAAAEPAPLRPARYALLQRALHDPVSVAFLLGACLAQLADTVTTALALGGQGYFEANGLMRQAVTQPLVTGLLKLALVGLVCLLAMLRLPRRQARLALLFAFGLSAFAPVQNAVQLLLH